MLLTTVVRRAFFTRGGHTSWQAQGKPRVSVVQGRLRDRRKGSERLYFEVQISWQAWPAQHFVNLEVQIS